MSEVHKLNPHPSRTDLTDRECSKLLGSLIGGLCMMADLATVRDAVRWWADSDDAWRAMEDMARAGAEEHRQILGTLPITFGA
jgi:2-phospho-L-lactate transferase/gluconeogenesis factor (CofD/UPF0052 family)